MILSAPALAALGGALASRRMPLPRPGVPNDEHIKRWAIRLGVRCVHTNLLWYSSLPADARLVATVAARLGRDLADYAAPNTREAAPHTRRSDPSASGAQCPVPPLELLHRACVLQARGAAAARRALGRGHHRGGRRAESPADGRGDPAPRARARDGAAVRDGAAEPRAAHDGRRGHS